MRAHLTFAATLVSATLLAPVGCSRAAKVVHQDLVERASSAERRFPYVLVRFGPPVAEP